MSNLTDLNAATVTLLAKALAAAAKTARGSLEPGEFTVDEQVLLQVSGSIKVGEDYDQRFVNKAKPWNIISVLLTELNTERSAAGKAGIDMSAVIAMAEAVDPKLAKQAQKDAETQAAGFKAPTMKTAKGKVTTKGGAEAMGGNV